MANVRVERLLLALQQNAFVPGEPVAQRRAVLEQAAAKARPPQDVTVEPVEVGDRPGEWLQTSDADGGCAILYLHGGGYVLGSCATHRSLAAWLARSTGAKVLTVDYRLAPEDPFPAAVEDACAAYRWLLEQGADPGRLAVVGDSAGGGLSVATLLALRGAGLAQPAGAVAISPWADLTASAASLTAPTARDPQIRREVLLEMASDYLGEVDRTIPLASPCFGDLHGLAPLLIQVGTIDGLLDDAIALTRAAAMAGVEVTCECWPDMPHVWHAFAPILPEAEYGLARIATWLADRWATVPRASDSQVAT